MAYPVHAVTMPAVLAGKTNGRLPSESLVDTPGLAGGVTVRLVAPAAAAWRALTEAASAAGHTLKATSVFDSYRPYEVQERVFRDRYTTAAIANRPSVIWNGKRWYQKPNTAVAAVPGTSNHGWGLAVDTGEERDSDADAESLDNATLAWLIANEFRFGFSHEVQSEPWHIRYWAGDNPPPAVANRKDDDMAWFVIREAGPHKDMAGWYAGGTFQGAVSMAEYTQWKKDTGNPNGPEVTVTHAEISCTGKNCGANHAALTGRRIGVNVVDLAAKPAVGTGDCGDCLKVGAVVTLADPA